MTNEEAIKRVKNSCYFTKALTMNDAIKDNIAINMAIKALEKQIPKKPVKSNKIHEIGFCPNCNEPIKSRTCYKSSVGKVYISWCSECGQKIDWREVEE